MFKTLVILPCNKHKIGMTYVLIKWLYAYNQCQSLHGYLHDQKVRVVDIQSNGAKQILDSQVVCIYTIYEVFIASTYDHLHNTNKKQFVL